MGVERGAEDIDGQARVVAIADEAGRHSERVAPDDCIRSRHAKSATAREALHVRGGIVEHAAQRFGAAGDAEGFTGALTWRGLWRLGRRGCISPERANTRRAAILNGALVAGERERKARAPRFWIGVIDGAGA